MRGVAEELEGLIDGLDAASGRNRQLRKEESVGRAAPLAVLRWNFGTPNRLSG